MLLPALLVTTLLSYVNAETNITADVQAFISKYHSLQDSKDILNVLDRIGDDARELFRLGQPVGVLLRTFNNTGEATVEEFNAMVQLNKLFKEREDDVHYDADGIGHFIMINHYESAGEHQISEMMTHIEQFTDAEVRGRSGQKSIGNMIMMRRHMKELNPMSTLSNIDTMVRVGCEVPTREQVTKLGNLLAAFQRIELMARPTWKERDLLYLVNNRKYQSHLISTRATPEALQKLIDGLNALTAPTYAHVYVILQEMHGGGYDLSLLQGMCIMEHSMDTNVYNQTAAYTLLRRIHEDLSRIALLSWAMSSIMETSEHYYYKDTEIAALSLERTGQFLAQWTRSIQKLSWPEVGVMFAKILIDSVPPISAYNETAKKVQKTFEDHGPEDYKYHVLVLPTSEVNVSWAVGTVSKEDYVNVTNFHGLDIHVFRWNRTEHVESTNARFLIKQDEQVILRKIRHVALSTARNALAHLQQNPEIGPIYSEGHYRSVILLRNKQTSVNKTEMPIGLAVDAKTSYTMETKRVSYSVSAKGRETEYKWKAYFFL